MSNTQNQGNLKLKTADLTFADILTGDPVQKQEAQAEAHSRHYKEQLALKLIDYARDELIIHLPYFNRAILKMPVRFYEPKLVEEDFGAPFGVLKYTKDHVISVQNDVDTRYQAYLDVQNELVAAYNELREECAQKYFHKSYNELDEDQQKKIQKIYPQKISEAEPKNYGN